MKSKLPPDSERFLTEFCFELAQLFQGDLAPTFLFGRSAGGC